MRQPAGAEDDDTLVTRERIHRAADRLAEVVTAVTGGRRVLDDVDAERDDFARPRSGSPNITDNGTVSP